MDDMMMLWAIIGLILFVFMLDYMNLRKSVAKLQKQSSSAMKPNRMIHYYDNAKG
jgi:hypothetical protein